MVFEFSSQSSVLLYLGYAIDRHDTTLIYITRESPEKQRSNTHSKITKTLTPTLEHRYFEDREDHTNALIQYSKALQIGKCRVDDEIVAMLRILHILSSSKEHDDIKKGHNDDVHLNLVPVQPWFRIVPQLFARLQANSSGNIVIQKLLLRISRFAPLRIVYVVFEREAREFE